MLYNVKWAKSKIVPILWLLIYTYVHEPELAQKMKTHEMLGWHNFKSIFFLFLIVFISVVFPVIAKLGVGKKQEMLFLPFDNT